MEVKTIAEQLLFSTVRIETDLGVGTGFILNKTIGETSFIYIITNKHVIKDAKKIKFFFLKSDGKNPLLGNELNFEVEPTEKVIFNHPDEKIDLCLIDMDDVLSSLTKHGVKLFIKAIPLEIFCIKDVEQYDALEKIIFIGYPNGIFDTSNFLPIIREGITATPYCLDYCGKKQFLIDASVFPGSSGSPVFVYNKGFRQSRDGTTHVGGGCGFLGVISSVLIQNDKGELDFEEVPTTKNPILRYKHLMDLGVVIKAECVEKLVNLYVKKIDREANPKLL